MNDRLFHKTGEPVRLWTMQSSAVLSCVRNQGVSRVKKEYINLKYGESAWIFREAYSFFREYMEKRIPAPEGAWSPVWLFRDPKWLTASEDSVLLELSLPAERVLFFDRTAWQKVLNLGYVGTEETERAFSEELRKNGLSGSFEVFSTPFYPALRQKIKKSWEGIFDLSRTGEEDVQGAVWELRREDIFRESGMS